MNDVAPQLRVIAFAEPPPQGKSGPVQLQVYILNESPATLAILNDLDSINIPRARDAASSTESDADLMHVDFGVSGSARFVQVPGGESLKVTLLLREEQLELLTRVKQMKTAVKFRPDGDRDGEVTTVLLTATVYRTNQ